MLQLIDLMKYSVSAALLLYLCKGALTWKEKYARQGKYLFFLLFVVCGFWFSNSAWFEEFLYKDNMIMQRSSMTIIKLLIRMFSNFILLDFFYEGRKLLKTYLVLLYRVIMEMAVFSLYGFWTFCLQAYSDWQINRVIDNDMALEDYMAHMKSLGNVWNLVLVLIQLCIAYIAVRAVLKYRQDMQNTDKQGILFLMLSPAVGMAFDLILRCLVFTQTETAEIEFLFDKYKGMYAFIPAMTFLCLLSIVYSCKIFKELMNAQEEKNRLLFYEQQLSDMTKHVQDMERLYDGIRGMRHDMNNYIADMEQLFLSGISDNKAGGAVWDDPDGKESVQTEGRQYLYRMKETLDALTIRDNTGNPVTDVIMSRKRQECEKEGITLESDFLYPIQLGIEAFDLGILLNNALDNAMEACIKCRKKKQPLIRVHSYLKGRMFLVRIENDCDGNEVLYTADRTLRTTKEDDSMHGIGLKNMDSVAGRYFGTMSYEVKDDVFCLTIMLQGKT